MTTDSERGPDARTALDRCITIPAAEFAAEYWGVRPLLTRANQLGQDFSDLFSLEAVDELVADRAIRTPFVRMANEGNLLPPARYTGPAGFGAEVSDQLDSDKVLTEFAGGATLVLQGLHRTWAPLREFTRRLVEELGHLAQVNAYITPASSRGFDPHYDVHDVFVIQIHGQKHWVIHEPVHPHPLADQPWSDHAEAVAAQAAGAPEIDAVFSPGDVLYLPRGWIHSATALAGTSIHLTIGVSAMTRWDVVQQLVAGLADDPRLRTALPIGVTADDAALDSIVFETITAISESLTEAAEPAAVGRALAGKLRASTRPEPVHPIATVERLAALAGSDPVRWRDGLGARVVAGGGRVEIVMGRRTVSLPGEASQAIESLAAGVASTAGSLPGLDEASSLVVARRLVREGILVLG